MRRTPPSSLLVAALSAVVVLVFLTSRGEATLMRVDHSAYDALLAKYVDANGLVDYATWKASDVLSLKAYLTTLSATDPDGFTDRHEELAFWINAYNALTIDAILHFYPVTSIKDKVSRLFGYNVWDDYPLRVAGRSYSLNDIEHKVLRPVGEPRVHFAIVCASIGCPKLRREAYAADRLDAQLDNNARDFFGSSDRFHIDRATHTVYLSPILRWFGEGTRRRRRIARIFLSA